MRRCRPSACPTARWTSDADAVVVALKSRTIPAAEAVAQSLAGAALAAGAGRAPDLLQVLLHLRLDAAGNIGPVTEALMDALGTDFTIATPAFPDNGRTVFKGYLFVGDVLLNESGMRNHPLTPMTDANLVRVLQAQCKRKVGLVDHRSGGAAAPAGIRERFARCASEGVRHRHRRCGLQRRPAAARPGLADLPLVTAGSGVAIGPAAELRAARWRRAARPRACPPHAACAPSCPAAARWPPTRRCAARCRRRGLRDRSAALARRRRRRGRRWRWAADRWPAGTGAGLCHGGAGSGARGAGEAGRGRRAGALVEAALAASPRPGASGRGPAGRGRRRDLGRRSCRRWACAPAHRPADRSRRALVPCRVRRRRPAPRAEVRQLRRHRLLHAKPSRCCA
jgi:hypothetical protein